MAAGAMVGFLNIWRSHDKGVLIKVKIIKYANSVLNYMHVNRVLCA